MNNIILLILITFIIILVVIILGIIILVINKKYFQKFNNPISIINLVLYSDNNEYNEMYKLTREYYKKFKNVKTIYYKFNETINENYILNDDILNIKGKETYVPGILDKTIKAFGYINDNYQFNYIVRSNISTIVNFDLLTKFLKNNHIEYGGGMELVLQNNYIDILSGIIDNTYVNTHYASGTSIILSKNTINYIVNNKQYIKYNLIDDVAIGIFINEHMKSINKIYTPRNYFIYIMNENGNNKKLIDKIKYSDYIFYRNRQNDRKIDILQMKIIIDNIN